MTLHEYLNRSDAPSLTELGERTGTSKSRLSQLRHSTDWPPALALAVEDATGGVLLADALSPVIAKARKRAAA